jgi:hypothetical protein
MVIAPDAAMAHIPRMTQTTQIPRKTLHRATQRLVDLLHATLARECRRLMAKEDFADDDCIRVALSAVVSVAAQLAGDVGADPRQLAASFVTALGGKDLAVTEEVSEPGSRLNRRICDNELWHQVRFL